MTLALEAQLKYLQARRFLAIEGLSISRLETVKVTTAVDSSYHEDREEWSEVDVLLAATNMFSKTEVSIPTPFAKVHKGQGDDRNVCYLQYDESKADIVHHHSEKLYDLLCSWIHP